MESELKENNKSLLVKYGICFAVAALIAFIIFWMKGFFTERIDVNLQILSDGFSISGMLFLFIAGMMFISGEGGLIGVSFVFRSVALIFIPMGRKKHETYDKYRERKLGEIKKSGDSCFLVTGLLFFGIGVILTVIWYMNFYNIA